MILVIKPMILVIIMRFHDAHCHLTKNYFYNNIDNLITDWKQQGLEQVIGVSTTIREAQTAIELHERYPEIIPGIGIHPWKAKKPLNEKVKESIQTILDTHETLVLGEIGLDFHFIKEKERYKHQREYLHYFLELAEKKQLPINLHTKGAEHEIIEMLESYKLKPTKILIHWYSGPENILKKLSDNEVFFTINPSVLTNSTHKEVIEIVKLDQILTESDGDVKYTVDGKRIKGTPVLVPRIIEKIASIKGKSIQEITEILHNNFLRYIW